MGRLIVLYDDNEITIDGNTTLSFTENVGQRYGLEKIVVAVAFVYISAVLPVTRLTVGMSSEWREVTATFGVSLRQFRMLKLSMTDQVLSLYGPPLVSDLPKQDQRNVSSLAQSSSLVFPTVILSQMFVPRTVYLRPWCSSGHR